VSGMFDRTDRQQGGRCEDDEKVILEIFQGREKRSRSMLLSSYRLDTLNNDDHL
jgi:hypothetical protein